MSCFHNTASSIESFENNAIALNEPKEEENVTATPIVSELGLKDFEALFPNAIAEQVAYYRKRHDRDYNADNSLPKRSKRIRNKKIAVALANNEEEKLRTEKTLRELDHSPDLYTVEDLMVTTIDN